MIDTIYSAHLLKNALTDIPKEIDSIFKNCNDFFGNINVYKISIEKKDTIIITNIEKNNLSIYDMVEFLRISKEIENTEEKNMDLINKWRLKTIYLKKNYDEDYDYMNFFDIFPSDNPFSLKFYFDFEHNKFMYSDKKGGPHFTENQLKYIEQKIKIKKNPFDETPSEDYGMNYFA
jgi:hypothetical protein